tara:strand:- start:72 stop:281 length:210 start_codon:yes stop_codon:yes gene_type:complete
MKIKVNGEEKLLHTNNKLISLNEAIKILGYTSNTIVVELNDLIVNSERWGGQNIQEGDKLEIVSIVGGG